MIELNLQELASEAFRLSGKIDAGVRELSEQAAAEAECEHDYREARARAWLTVGGSAKEKEDQVDSVTAGYRLARDLARGKRQAALEALRSRRQQLSAVQTLVSALKAETEHARYSPEVGP